jgi:hypothetical protein
MEGSCGRRCAYAMDIQSKEVAALIEGQSLDFELGYWDDPALHSPLVSSCSAGPNQFVHALIVFPTIDLRFPVRANQRDLFLVSSIREQADAALRPLLG